MRKLTALVSALMLSCQLLMADSCGLPEMWCNPCDSLLPDNGCYGRWPSPLNVVLGVGYRYDDLRWSIAGPNGFPNVLSELKWKDLRSVQVGGEATYTSCRNYVVKVSGYYGKIYHGHASDKDFLNDGREDPFSYIKADAGRGWVYDLSAGAGYRVTSTYGRFIANILAGYAWDGQHLHMFDGDLRMSLVPGAVLGPFSGLDTTYKTRWYGPWIGGDFTVKVEQCAYLYGGFEWHFATYRADGNWNLRTDIGPFRDKAWGYGYLAWLGGFWEIWRNFSIGVVGEYRNYKTRSGTQTTRLVGNPFFEFAEQRINRVRWHNVSASGIIAWRY